MKSLLPLLGLLFLTASWATAQNPMMKDFGSTYDEVQTFLEGRNCDLKYDKELIIAKTGTLTLEYHFRDNQLYQMSIDKRFDKRKASLEAMDSFRSHYQLIGAELIEMEQDRSRQSFVALFERNLNEVNCFPDEEKELHVQLTARNLDFYPDEKKAMLNEEMREYSALASIK